jgi:hypothetical protein
MNELLQRIVAFIPAYVGNLVNVVQGPKRFIRGRLSHQEHQLEDALLFLGISFLIGWVLKLSFVGKELFKELLADSGFILMMTLGYGLAVCLAWRTVKGRADTQKHLIIHFYYSGVLILGEACWFMALIGILKAGSPQFYTQLMDSVQRGNLRFFVDPRNADALSRVPGFWLVYCGGIIAAIGWWIAGWGAYRELNRLSKLRSAIAAVLFVILSILVSGGVFLFASAAQNVRNPNG